MFQELHWPICILSYCILVNSSHGMLREKNTRFVCERAFDEFSEIQTKSPIGILICILNGSDPYRLNFKLFLFPLSRMCVRVYVWVNIRNIFRDNDIFDVRSIVKILLNDSYWQMIFVVLKGVLPLEAF